MKLLQAGTSTRKLGAVHRAHQAKGEQRVVHLEATGDLQVDPRQAVAVQDRHERVTAQVVSDFDGAQVGEQAGAHA